MDSDDLCFTDNSAIKGREGHYTELHVQPVKILKSWRESLFSFEWLRPDGQIREMAELSPQEQPRRADVERRLSARETLEKPVLGIGILDNVEIGAGKAVFLTLAARGVRSIPVHVPKSHVDEFKPYLSQGHKA